MNKYSLIQSEQLSGADSHLGVFRRISPIPKGKYFVAWHTPGKIEVEESEIDIISPDFSDRGTAAIFELGFKSGWERA